MRMSDIRLRGFGIFLLVPAIVAGTGCSFQPSNGDDPPNGNGAEPGTVLIVFRNLSLSDAVQVNFHASEGPFGVLPDELFIEANLITRDIGVAGTGIIQPQGFDFLRDFPCSGDLVLGTSGGHFLDNESGDQTGIGPVRWAQASALGFCGGAVTFTFNSSGGQFTTEFSIIHSVSSLPAP